MRHGVLFLNPGSAGPRRFKLPVSLAIIVINEEGIKPQLIELQVAHKCRRMGNC
jgi:predicted phosphodiesterase